MTELSFKVRGIPAPQGSKNAYVNKHTGRVNLVESAGDRLKAWRTSVHAAAILAATTARKKYDWKRPKGAVQVNVWFLMPRPKSHYRTGKYADLLKDNAPLAHTFKPDTDKLLRSTMDALVTSGVIKDDSTITSIVGHKQYVRDEYEEVPGATILIKALE